jgi:hypothetical protein
VSKPSNAFRETEALRKDSKGMNAANAVASAATRKKTKMGKLCLGMERVLINRGKKNISARMPKNTIESGATDAPWKSLARAGKLVNGKHNNNNAQQTSVIDCQTLGFTVSCACLDFIDMEAHY